MANLRRYSTTPQLLKYGDGNSSAEMRTRQQCESNKVIGKILIGIVVVFVICWSPVNILMVITDAAPSLIPREEVSTVNP